MFYLIIFVQFLGMKNTHKVNDLERKLLNYFFFCHLAIPTIEKFKLRSSSPSLCFFVNNKYLGATIDTTINAIGTTHVCFKYFFLPKMSFSWKHS